MRNYATTFIKFINEKYTIFENENSVFTQVTSELGSFKNAEISRDSIAWKQETPSGEYWDLTLFMKMTI